MASFHNVRIQPRHRLEDVEQAVAAYCASGTSADHVVFTRVGRDGALYLYPLARAGAGTETLRTALLPVARHLTETLVKRSLWMSMQAVCDDGATGYAEFPTDDERPWSALADLVGARFDDATAWLVAESALHAFGRRAGWDLFCLERGARAARADGFARLGPVFAPRAPVPGAQAAVRDVRGSRKVRDDGRLRLSLELDAPGTLRGLALTGQAEVTSVSLRQGAQEARLDLATPRGEVALDMFALHAPTDEERALGDRRYRVHVEVVVAGWAPGCPVTYTLAPDGSVLVDRAADEQVQRSPSG